MTDQKLATKLKSRIDSWHGYMDQAQRPRQKSCRATPPEQDTITVAPEEPAAPIPAPAPADTGTGALIPYQDSLVARYESQIADLRESLAHERSQSRRLAETLAREQALRVFPQAQAAPAPAASLEESYRRKRSRARYEDRTLSSGLVLGLSLFVLVGVISTVVAIAVLR